MLERRLLGENKGEFWPAKVQYIVIFDNTDSTNSYPCYMLEVGQNNAYYLYNIDNTYYRYFGTIDGANNYGLSEKYISALSNEDLLYSSTLLSDCLLGALSATSYYSTQWYYGQNNVSIWTSRCIDRSSGSQFNSTNHNMTIVGGKITSQGFSGSMDVSLHTIAASSDSYIQYIVCSKTRFDKFIQPNLPYTVNFLMTPYRQY